MTYGMEERGEKKKKNNQNLNSHFTPDVIYHTKAAFYYIEVFHTVKYH